VPRVVLAAFCHPDDIEFSAGGTLWLLRQAGCELHYMTVANGSMGSMTLDAERAAEVRSRESRAAAAFLGARWHPPITGDLEVFYTDDLIRRLLAVVRAVAPDIMLVPAPEDYMEDHVNTSRIAVTAAFCRGMPNYRSIPEVPPVQKEVTLYHALPHGLRDQLRREVRPDFYVDVSAVIVQKEQMLALHASQRDWLDTTQGMGSYVASMRDLAAAAGRMSGVLQYAEGWRRHNHLGFSRAEAAPLEEILGQRIVPGGAG
jgi:LmbE family N-acetylglucosaminyl deacetylase